MIRRPCPRCQTLNSTENRFCGQCGVPLMVQTIIFSQDDNEPYRVEIDERPATPGGAPPHTGHVRQALAVGAAAVAAELALVYVEQRLLRGRALGSARMRQVRNGALSTLTGAVLLLAEQSLASRSGSGHAGR